MNGPLLITRPEPGASQSAAFFANHNIATSVAPLFTIAPLPITLPPIQSFSALIFTSANGVRAFAEKNTAPHLPPIYAIGPMTAQALETAGLALERQFNGDRAAMTDWLIHHVAQTDKPLLHLRGADQAGNLAENLSAAERPCTSLALYKAEAVSSLPLRAQRFMAQKNGTILLMSARAARLFTNLLDQTGQNYPKQRFSIAVPSQAVAEYLNPADWRSIYRAEIPTMDGILTALQQEQANHG